jgi:hypothetical protein
MLKRHILVFGTISMGWACSPSWPEPRQPLVDAEAAARSAHEVGADAQPAAKLKVTLAEEQINAAKAEMGKGENERATYLLVRARADAELALALAHEQQALEAKRQALQDSQASQQGVATQPAPVSIPQAVPQQPLPQPVAPHHVNGAQQ